MIPRVRGTQDILDLSLHNFVVQAIQKHLELHNFSQVQTPTLEHTDLFTRSLGTHTDVVHKEMYTFQTASGESICLRPEATASTVRAFLENRIEKTPWKVFSHGSMFRHERPQKGRWREFTQINMEIIGSHAIEQDAHFLYIMDRFFADVLKLENYVIKINFLGCLQDRQEHRKSLHEFLTAVKDTLCNDCNIRKEKNMLRIFDCKETNCREIYRKAPLLTSYLCPSCSNEWKTLNTLLDITSVSRIHDPFLVRGLDYYNKTVFEFVSTELGAQNAFGGGGRYNLTQELGAQVDYPSIGAAIGLGRLLMLVENVKDKLCIPQPPALCVIIPMTEAQKTLALLLAHDLTTKNVCNDVLLDITTIGSMMKKANKMGAKYVLVLGEQEQNNGTVSIKNMITGEQRVVTQTKVNEHLT